MDSAKNKITPNPFKEENTLLTIHFHLHLSIFGDRKPSKPSATKKTQLKYKPPAENLLSFFSIVSIH